jgi:hypothetical protein
MAVALDDFTAWIDQADIPASYRTKELDALLAAVFRFRQQQGNDYYSTRLLSHFLLHCDCGLKVAQIARLLGIARPTASKQQGLSSKAALVQAHHRMDGRSHGKLLPRFAGPIAAFLVRSPKASQADLLDFVEHTFAVRVSRIALYKFRKKYGLHDVDAPPQPPTSAQPGADCTTDPPEESPAAAAAANLSAAMPVELPFAPATTVAPVLGSVSVPTVEAPLSVIELARLSESGKASAPPFSSGGRTMPAPSC